MNKTNKKGKGKRRTSRNVVIEITDDDYRHEVNSGVSEVDALQPGRHVFQRGAFKRRHPNIDVKKAPVKVRVNISLDRDIVDYFKESANSQDAANYETQINHALRSMIDRKTARNIEFMPLVNSDDFIEAVAKRVAQRRASRRTSVKNRPAGKPTHPAKNS